MLTWLPALAALSFSLPGLWLLGWRNSKRLRAARRREQVAWSRLEQRGLILLVISPGLVLIFADLWPAFLLWMLLGMAGGWFTARLLAPRTRSIAT